MQIAAAHNLREEVKKGVEGRAKLGVEAFAEALLGIPKILAQNCGFDAQVHPLITWEYTCMDINLATVPQLAPLMQHKHSVRTRGCWELNRHL